MHDNHCISINVSKFYAYLGRSVVEDTERSGDPVTFRYRNGDIHVIVFSKLKIKDNKVDIHIENFTVQKKVLRKK